MVPKVVTHYCSNLLQFTGQKSEAYKRALKSKGVIEVKDDKKCAWTEVIVEAGSLADALLKPLSMHRREK